MAVGDPDRQPGRAQLLAAEGAVWLAWQEFDGEATTIALMTSRDGGATWSTPRAVAQTLDAADQPVLVATGARVFLSWLTRAEGYRLLPLEAAP
jgi:Neuraminidase (sialidase)